MRFQITCSAIVSPASAAPTNIDNGAPPSEAKGWYFMTSASPNGNRLMGITVPEKIETIAMRIRPINQFIFLSLIDRQANRKSTENPREIQSKRLKRKYGDAGSRLTPNKGEKNAIGRENSSSIGNQPPAVIAASWPSTGRGLP